MYRLQKLATCFSLSLQTKQNNVLQRSIDFVQRRSCSCSTTENPTLFYQELFHCGHLCVRVGTPCVVVCVQREESASREHHPVYPMSLQGRTGGVYSCVSKASHMILINTLIFFKNTLQFMHMPNIQMNSVRFFSHVFLCIKSTQMHNILYNILYDYIIIILSAFLELIKSFHNIQHNLFNIFFFFIVYAIDRFFLLSVFQTSSPW